jgi:palmitoyl transferase
MGRTLLGTVLLWLVLSDAAQADQWALLVNGHAMHLRDTEDGYDNEANYGLGIQYDFTRGGRGRPFVFANGFQDSRKDPSYAVGGGYRVRLVEGTGYLDAGFAAMLMTRRDHRDGEPFPALLPLLSVGVGRVGLNALYVPELDSLVPLLFFQLRFVLD